MKNRFSVCMCLVLLVLGCPLLVSGQEEKGPGKRHPAAPLPPPPPMEPTRQINAPPLEMISAGVFEIGGVRISKKQGRVEFPANVNMDKGLLEYLIVGDSGKLHESLLRTKVEPYCIQIALLMIGLEGSTNPLSEQGDPRRPEGNPVTIWVQRNKANQTEKLRIEEWVTNKERGGPMKPIEWIFTGSIISNGVFMAQVDKSIVAIFHDPVALIDNPLPEGASDEVWFVNENKVPPIGTEVRVFIQK